jgi:hypothetical protein
LTSASQGGSRTRSALPFACQTGCRVRSSSLSVRLRCAAHVRHCAPQIQPSLACGFATTGPDARSGPHDNRRGRRPPRLWNPVLHNHQDRSSLEPSGPRKHTPLTGPPLAVACCPALISKQRRRSRRLLQSRATNGADRSAGAGLAACAFAQLRARRSASARPTHQLRANARSACAFVRIGACGSLAPSRELRSLGSRDHDGRPRQARRGGVPPPSGRPALDRTGAEPDFATAAS